MRELTQNNNLYSLKNDVESTSLLHNSDNYYHIDSGLSPIPEYNYDWRFLFSSDKGEQFGLTYFELIKKILIIGEQGSGKTNALYALVYELNRKLERPFINIIFDSKGDFIKRFYREGDYVIEAFPNGNYPTVVWNIFDEILTDNVDLNIGVHAREQAKMLASTLDMTGRNKFFVDAVVTFLEVAITILCKDYYSKGTRPTNKSLVEFFDLDLNRMIIRAKEYNLDINITKLVSLSKKSGYDGQTLGILAELSNVISDLFIGEFRKNGDFSIRKAITSRKTCNIFIEYDVEFGNTISPIYAHLINLAIKEACGRASGSKVNLIIDEFSLLPKLNEMEKAVSFGRESGLFIVLALQHIGQIREKYDKDIADGMLNNLRSMFLFRSDDYETRLYAQHRFGEMYKRTTSYNSLSDRISTYSLNNRISDMDILSLNIGEAIISIAGSNDCFKFKFSKTK